MAVPLSLDETLPKTEGKTIALFGDLSTKRNQMVKQFILDGFQNEGTSCIVTLTSSANDLIDELSNYSPDAAMIINDAILNERLQIIDMYSFRGIREQEEDSIPGTYMLGSADDLTILSISLNKISKAHPKTRVILWPYSLLTIYNSNQDMINFTQTLSARLNTRKQTGLLIADSGVIQEQQRSTIESIVDCVVETKKVEHEGVLQEWFRVKFFRGEDDHAYDVWTLTG